jgi:ParB-like nuclease domain
MEVMDVPIAKIRVVENVRMDVNDAQIKDLMSSIKQHGLLEPVGVVPADKKSNYFNLNFGQRRLTACKKLGHKTIPAVIGDAKEQADFLIVNTIENIQRKDITPSELGRICEKLIKLDYTESEIAVRLGIPVSRVRGSYEVYKSLGKDFRDKVIFASKGERRNGGVPTSVAKHFNNLRRAYGMKKTVAGLLWEEIRHKELSSKDLAIIVALISQGLSVKQAIKERNVYKCYRIDIVASKIEMEKMEKKYEEGSISLIRKAAYGISEHIPCPKFIK